MMLGSLRDNPELLKMGRGQTRMRLVESRLNDMFLEIKSAVNYVKHPSRYASEYIFDLITGEGNERMEMWKWEV